MTKTSEQNEALRDEFTNSHHNPGMRPAVDALRSKLRKLPSLDDPRAAELVIDDMIYFRFVRQPHPRSLWYIMQQATSYWTSLLGFEEARQLEWVQNEFGRADDLEKVSLPPQGESSDLPPPVGSDWNTSVTRGNAEYVIGEHEYDPYMKKGINVPRCTCGKEFEFREQWIKHVRIKIWRAIKDEGND